MFRRIVYTIFALALTMVANTSYSQPYDLIIPDESSPDGLTKELRNLQAVERDLAIEKLTREPDKLDAYIELGDLRLAQGKLQEAQRFYEMALELSPKNLRANQGLVMVHYHLGEFNLARDRIEEVHKFSPLSDHMRDKLETYKRCLKNEAQLGLLIREDDRGLSEIVSSIGGYFPSSHYPKLTARYRFENWSHKDNGTEISTRLYSGTLNYKVNNNTSLMLTYAPETFPGGDTINGYDFQGIAGTDNLKLALKSSKNTFKDNLFTLQNRLSEQTKGLSLFGDLHQRTRIVQSVTMSEISDGNSKQRYDSELIHCVFRNNAPFLTTTLRFYQGYYETQHDANGNLLNYWAPANFNTTELELAWERSVGARWWWGIDTSLIASHYRFGSDETITDTGAGAFIHLSYRFDNGSLYASIGDRLHDYFRERRLEVYGNISF